MILPGTLLWCSPVFCFCSEDSRGVWAWFTKAFELLIGIVQMEGRRSKAIHTSDSTSSEISAIFRQFSNHGIGRNEGGKGAEMCPQSRCTGERAQKTVVCPLPKKDDAVRVVASTRYQVIPSLLLFSLYMIPGKYMVQRIVGRFFPMTRCRNRWHSYVITVKYTNYLKKKVGHYCSNLLIESASTFASSFILCTSEEKPYYSTETPKNAFQAERGWWSHHRHTLHALCILFGLFLKESMTAPTRGQCSWAPIMTGRKQAWGFSPYGLGL